MRQPEIHSPGLVVVCLCTYRRPSQLSRALDSLVSIARPASTVFLVVDNDGRDPEIERRVRNFGHATGARVEYVVESSPGISAARNAAIGAARLLGARTLAMLDDDEWATPDWLMQLLAAQKATGAGIVGGPVRPVFPAHKKELKRYADL